MHLVVARYTEDLGWLRDTLERHPGWTATVYNDGAFDIPAHARIDVLPGDGLPQEATKYLRFILDHYDSLHDRLIFLQGDPMYHNPTLGTVLDCAAAWDPGYQNVSLWAHPPPWGPPDLTPCMRILSPDGAVFRDTMGDDFQGALFRDPWLEETFPGLSLPRVCEILGVVPPPAPQKAYAAMFATDASSVRRYSRETWIRIHEFVASGAATEFAHRTVKERACIMEYMWAVMLAPGSTPSRVGWSPGSSST